MTLTDRHPRPDKDTFFMSLAVLVSTRATCPKRLVGAVLVQDGVIRGTGYNGAPAGIPDCFEVGCDNDESNHCIRTIHAEANVILSTDTAHRQGATVYCTDMPCYRCATLLANSGIKRVVWARLYAQHAPRVEKLFEEKGIALDYFEMPQSVTGGLLPPVEVMRTLGLEYSSEQLASKPLPHK